MFLKLIVSVSLTLASWSVSYIYKNWSSGWYSLSLPLVSLTWGAPHAKQTQAGLLIYLHDELTKGGGDAELRGCSKHRENPPPPHHNDRTLVHCLHMPLWRVSIFRGKITQPLLYDMELHIPQCTLLWPVLLSSPDSKACIRAACLCTLVWASGVHSARFSRVSHCCLQHSSFHPCAGLLEESLCSITGS